MFQWLQIRTNPLLTAKYASPLLRKSSCFLNCVFPKMRSKGTGPCWPRLQSAAFQVLCWRLRAPFLAIHMVGFDRSCLLNLLFWTRFSEPNKMARKGSLGGDFPVFRYFQLFIFPVEVREKGGKWSQSRQWEGHSSFRAPKKVPSPSLEICAFSRGIASWISSPSSNLAMPRREGVDKSSQESPLSWAH